MDEDTLRVFLFNELLFNEKLRDAFNSYKNRGLLLDKNYYLKKLDKIVKISEGGDYEHHGIHDIMLFGPLLEDFILNDVWSLVSRGEYDFAAGSTK